MATSITITITMMIANDRSKWVGRETGNGKGAEVRKELVKQREREKASDARSYIVVSMTIVCIKILIFLIFF